MLNFIYLNRLFVDERFFDALELTSSKMRLMSRIDPLNNSTRLSRTKAKIGENNDFDNIYSYNTFDELTSIIQFAPNNTTKIVRYSYNAASQRISTTRDENLMTSIATTNYSYDGIGRLQEIEHKRSTEVFADYNFTYDSASRITSINDSSYTYDSTDQLLGAEYDDQANETYEYDANGNRSNYIIGDNNQILSDGIYNYTYDAEGNRTSKTNIETDETTTYTWDNRNRLITVTTTDYTVNYRYDYLNRLVSRTVNQISETINPITPQPPTPTQTVQHFIHDGNQIVLEFEDNELAQRNLWGAAVDELLAVDNLIDDETLWILADHLNSTRNILKNDNGQVSNIASINYDAFGNIVDGENPINLGYTGKFFDQLTNLQWNINRWYDATTGQWISEDPIGFGGGDSNLYRYVRNNVINLADLDGLKPEWHHLLPKEFIKFFKDVCLDINAMEYGWILDKEYHTGSGKGKPGHAIHEKWNNVWKNFWYDYDKKTNEWTKKTRTKEEVLKQLDLMKKDSGFSSILKNGRQATMSYEEWQHGIKQIGEKAIQTKKTKKGMKLLLNACGKGAKGLVVITFTYDVLTDGVIVASTNAAEDLVWPLTDMIRVAEKNSLGPFKVSDALADAIEKGSTWRNELNNVDMNSIDFDTETLRPRINIPIK